MAGYYFVIASIKGLTYRAGSSLSEDEAGVLQFGLSCQFPSASFEVTYGLPKKIEDGNFEAFLDQHASAS